MRIYLASSWRNADQPLLVRMLRSEGYSVYDFRNPEEGDDGFHWSEIDGGWQGWSREQYVRALDHPVAERGFMSDFNAMEWANTFVLLLPCGRSAHLELGWATGAGKKTAILLADGCEPELMYKLADAVCVDAHELFRTLRAWSDEAAKGGT